MKNKILYAAFLLLPFCATALDQRPVLVVTGMAKEVDIVKGDGIITVLSAANGQQLRATLNHFDFSKVRAVVSFGVAGGLHPDLKPGHRRYN